MVEEKGDEPHYISTTIAELRVSNYLKKQQAPPLAFLYNPQAVPTWG